MERSRVKVIDMIDGLKIYAPVTDGMGKKEKEYKEELVGEERYKFDDSDDIRLSESSNGKRRSLKSLNFS